MFWLKYKFCFVLFFFHKKSPQKKKKKAIKEHSTGNFSLLISGWINWPKVRPLLIWKPVKKSHRSSSWNASCCSSPSWADTRGWIASNNVQGKVSSQAHQGSCTPKHEQWCLDSFLKTEGSSKCSVVKGKADRSPAVLMLHPSFCLHMKILTFGWNMKWHSTTQH